MVHVALFNHKQNANEIGSKMIPRESLRSQHFPVEKTRVSDYQVAFQLFTMGLIPPKLHKSPVVQKGTFEKESDYPFPEQTIFVRKKVASAGPRWLWESAGKGFGGKLTMAGDWCHIRKGTGSMLILSCYKVYIYESLDLGVKSVSREHLEP